MASTNVVVGMVGLGLVAPSHFKGYDSHPGARVAAVCDLDRQRAERFAAERGIPRIYTDYNDLLADPEINAVNIATPTFLHSPMTRQAALNWPRPAQRTFWVRTICNAMFYPESFSAPAPFWGWPSWQPLSPLSWALPWA